MKLLQKQNGAVCYASQCRTTPIAAIPTLRPSQQSSACSTSPLVLIIKNQPKSRYSLLPIYER